MSDNKHPNAMQVAAFFYDLSEEEQDKIGDIESPEGYSKALDALLASMGDSEEDQGSRERKKKEARMYSVFLVVQTGPGKGSIDLIGHGKGSIGREGTDPASWSEARHLQNKAQIRLFGLQKKGQTGHVLVIPSEDYLAGSFLAPPVGAPKTEDATPNA